MGGGGLQPGAGELSELGRPVISIIIEQGPTVLAVGASGRCMVFLSTIIFSL